MSAGPPSLTHCRSRVYESACSRPASSSEELTLLARFLGRRRSGHHGDAPPRLQHRPHDDWPRPLAKPLSLKQIQQTAPH